MPIPYLPHFSSSRRVRSGSVSTNTAFAFGERDRAYWMALTTPRWMSPTRTRTVLVIGGGGAEPSRESRTATSSEWRGPRPDTHARGGGDQDPSPPPAGRLGAGGVAITQPAARAPAPGR